MDVVRPGARLLVVSRGDDELLRFDNRAAWHFPRLDSGLYAGYHPASGKDAIEHLRALRDRGARNLLLPAPSFWWRDYYPELFEYLAENATSVWDGEDCLVFELAEPEAGAQDRPSSLVRPLERLLAALVPEGAAVAVLSSGDASLLALEGCETLHLPHEPGGGYAAGADAAEALDQLAQLGREREVFLVVPHVAPSWLDSYPEFLEEVEARYRCIASRQRVCTVYELNGHA